jgi:hypothetical protein
MQTSPNKFYLLPSEDGDLRTRMANPGSRCGAVAPLKTETRRRVTRAPKTETCGLAWRILGRGPARQKVADKVQGVALPTASGTLVLCFAARRAAGESLSSEALRAHLAFGQTSGKIHVVCHIGK